MREKHLLNQPLNIQLFAREAGAGGYQYGNVVLTEGEQARYANSIMRALGQDKKMPLQGWFAEAASKNAAYCIFYLSGKLAARDIDDTVVYENTNHTPANVKGQDITDFLRAVRVMAKGMECPVYVKRRDFDRSQLNEKSAIVDAQVAATYAKCANRIGVLLKDCATTKKRTVEGTNGSKYDLVIPDNHFYGDETQLFDTEANIKAFRMMMLKAQELADGQGLRIAIVAGTEGRGEIANAKRFSDRDFANGETTSTGQPLKQIFGGTIENLSGFDSVFYPQGNETVGYIAVMIEKSFGQDNKDVAVTPEVNYIPNFKSYLLDVEVYNSTELLNPEGVFFFKYKRDISGAAAAAMAARDMAPHQATPNVIDYDKAIALEQARAKRIAEERELLKEKQAILKAERPTEVTNADTEKVNTKKGKADKDPEGTKE